MSSFKQAVVISLSGSDQNIVISDFSDMISDGAIKELASSISYASEHLIKRFMGNVEINNEVMDEVFNTIEHYSLLFCNGETMHKMGVLCHFKDTNNIKHSIDVQLKRSEIFSSSYFKP